MNADQSAKPAPILLLVGCPGVSKTTVADAIAERFGRAMRIDLDAFRRLVVSGLVQPSQGWSDETTRQFELAHIGAGKVARLYSDAGFVVVVEHCSTPEMIELFVREAPRTVVIGIRADLAINLHRNATRTNKSFDPNDIAFFVHELHQSCPDQIASAGYAVIDSSALSVQETVDVVLARSGVQIVRHDA